MLKTLATLSLVLFLQLADAQNHIEKMPGFHYCNTKQRSRLESVEVPGCKKWPCIIKPGRSGVFKLKLFNLENRVISRLNSDIYGTVTLAHKRQQKVGMPGEVKKRACPFTSPGCPVAPLSYYEITKHIKIPAQARVVRGIMRIEFRVEDGAGRTLTCFRAPVMLG